MGENLYRVEKEVDGGNLGDNELLLTQLQPVAMDDTLGSLIASRSEFNPLAYCNGNLTVDNEMN